MFSLIIFFIPSRRVLGICFLCGDYADTLSIELEINLFRMP